MRKLTFITNLASFYKVNLYNELDKFAEVKVYFMDIRISESRRNSDFYGKNIKFKHQYMTSSNILTSIINGFSILFRLNSDTIVFDGWNRIEYYIIAILSPKCKNAVIVESSCWESKTYGFNGWVKRLFLKRMSKAYVPGESNKKLLEILDFKGEIIKTYGVGVFNFVEQAPYVEKNMVSKFIYVGRLSPEKNLDYIIKYFNRNPNLTLTIVGYGPSESDLKDLANDNIIFTGAVKNIELPSTYRAHDIFILPSLSEPWGLVVEEALNNGLPILLSDKVGCAEELAIDGKNGYVFTLDDDFSSLDLAVNKVTNIDTYNALCKYISFTDIEEYVKRQVVCYINK